MLEFPGSVAGPWARYVTGADPPRADGIGTVRYPRLVPKDDEAAAKVKKRTLTNLYNERPTWLDLAHQKLDAAAYGVTHVKTPNTTKSAGFVVRRDWIPAWW